ncbi:MAG: aminotransferase class I/II-fold pyridoxal phosphate-dependent enzyme, partial [Actinomycetota bacterium]|nr:aminotransferase class I/II-fold pyridoxal phosphate-dependent enzyme [Actinomycetota bacterium]
VAYRELGFAGTRLPSLWSLGPDVVVQAGTFSKTFFPGVRLGWAAGPVEIVSKLVWAKQNTDQCAGALGQRLLEEYGRRGLLDEQVAGACELYRGRRDLLLAALERHLDGLASWTRPEGGFFVWLDVGRDGAAVAASALEAGVAVVPGAPFFPDPGSGRANLRLSFSRVREDEIDDGVRRLAAAVTSTGDAA